MYMADLADFAECQVNLNSFADDMQTYLHCLPSDIDRVVCQLEGCIIEIGHWMSASCLKLNTDKTELVWTGSRHNLGLLGGCGPSLQLGDDVIEPIDHVRLLGVTVVVDLGLDRHVSIVCKTCFFWLRKMRRVCRSLDTESVKTLVHAFVTSRVDYCNLVLSSAPKKVMDKLQHVQNAAARLVTGTQKYEHGLSSLMHDDLHWLVIPQRVQYKLAVTVHRCLQHRAPGYLAEYCVPVSEVPGR